MGMGGKPTEGGPGPVVKDGQSLESSTPATSGPGAGGWFSALIGLAPTPPAPPPEAPQHQTGGCLPEQRDACVLCRKHPRMDYGSSIQDYRRAKPSEP